MSAKPLTARHPSRPRPPRRLGPLHDLCVYMYAVYIYIHVHKYLLFVYSFCLCIYTPPPLVRLVMPGRPPRVLRAGCDFHCGMVHSLR